MRIITRTCPGRYEQIGVLGSGTHDYSQQLKALLKARLTDKRLAEILTTPVYDEDGGITWQTPLKGDITPISELPESGQAGLRDKLDAALARIGNVVRTLEEAGDPDRAADARRLQAALQTPNGSDDLHSVGGAPVLVNWGMSSGGGAATGTALTSTRTGLCMTVGDGAVPAGPGGVGTDSGTGGGSMAVRRRACPGGIVGWLLFALIALLLLLFLLRGCMGDGSKYYPDLVELKRERSGLLDVRIRLESLLDAGELACAEAGCIPPGDDDGMDSTLPDLPDLPELPDLPDAPEIAEDDLCGRIERVLGDCDVGQISASLGWNSMHDLDIGMQTPSGDIIWWKQREGPAGGRLSVDSNAEPDARSRQPVENISWSSDDAPPGRYRMLVRLHAVDPRDRDVDPVPYTASIKIDGEFESVTGAIPLSDQGRWKLVREFEVGP